MQCPQQLKTCARPAMCHYTMILHARCRSQDTIFFAEAEVTTRSGKESSKPLFVGGWTPHHSAPTCLMCLPSPLAQIWSRFRKCCEHQPCERQSPEKTTDRRHHRNAVTKFMCHTGMTPEPNVLIVHEYIICCYNHQGQNRKQTLHYHNPITK